MFPTEAGFDSGEEPFIHFDQEHITRASDDIVDYWTWSINWIQAKLAHQVDPTDVRAGYQYVLLGRLPLTVMRKYTSGLYTPKVDQGAHTDLVFESSQPRRVR